MRLLFLRRNTAACYLIRAATWSSWSHVACVFGSVAYEAKAKCGVRTVHINSVLDGAADHAWAESPCNTEAARRFLDAQVGKPYDWTAVAGIMLHRDWQEDDSWFCSELAAAASRAGYVSLINKPTNRVTPEDVWTSPLLVREQ
jgi:uncharacterized protein YycO